MGPPRVTICTPTFNRRPFIPALVACIEAQDYPRDLIEWVVHDDGTDPIHDLIEHLPYLRYFRHDGPKLTVGAKRNFIADQATGDVLVHMDDDDYYPPQRVSHAVETLQANPTCAIAATSVIHTYFASDARMYVLRPRSESTISAASFALWRRLHTARRYDDQAAMAEESSFLRGITVSDIAQLDPVKTILVISHTQTSCDRTALIRHGDCVTVSELDTTAFLHTQELRDTYLVDIPARVAAYDAGLRGHKPDVVEAQRRISVGWHPSPAQVRTAWSEP